MHAAASVVAIAAGVGLVVWGAETFAEHLAAASVRLRVSTFALALLLAGAEPEELATSVTASLRHAPAIALGDVIGANLTACLVALGLGAVLVGVPFGRRVRRYAALGLPLGVVAVVVAWEGHVGRAEGAGLIALYVAFIVLIWAVERRPPAMGEAGEIREARDEASAGANRTGRDLILVLAGVVAMAVGASLLVEAVRRWSGVEQTQARLSLTIVGFATGFELVVLVWSSARRGLTEAAVAGVVGSFAYNSTMTLGAGALVRPLAIDDAGLLHVPWILMVAALALVLGLAMARGDHLDRPAGVALLAAYAGAVVVMLAG